MLKHPNAKEKDERDYETLREITNRKESGTGSSANRNKVYRKLVAHAGVAERRRVEMDPEASTNSASGAQTSKGSHRGSGL